MSDASPIVRAIRFAGSQAKLAHDSGLSQQLISKLLGGQRQYTADNALAIHKATRGTVALADMVPDLVSAVASELAKIKIEHPPVVEDA